MKKLNINSKKGFTIIEVVLVLAIAGLIFLMVFIALPALQRSQKDTQRRSDLSRFMSQIESYQSNNRNALPGDTAVTITGKTNAKKSELGSSGWANFYKNYLLAGTDDFADPDGEPYNLVVTNRKGATGANAGKEAQSDEFGTHNIHVYIQGICDGENVVEATGSRKVAITYKMEGGGVSCYNN